jgi:hypothetical protein
MGMLGSLLSEQKVNHTVGDAPANKVELGDGSYNLVTTHLEVDTGGPAKGVKQLLRVTIQTRLVCDMDSKSATCRGGIGQVVILRVVCHKVLQVSQGDAISVFEHVQKNLLMILILVKLGYGLE